MAAEVIALRPQMAAPMYGEQAAVADTSRPHDAPNQDPETQKYAATRDRIAEWRLASRENQQWRRDSIRAREYYDGNQADEMFAALLRKYGRDFNPENCIKRWINTLHGAQEDAKSDGVVTVEDNRFADFGEAMSAELKEAERLSGADRACLNAALTQFIVGKAWVEVGDGDDVFDYPDRCIEIPWREMSWDMAPRGGRDSDSEWYKRHRQIRRDILMATFPKRADWIRTCGAQGDAMDWNDEERYERDMWRWRDASQWRDHNIGTDLLAVNEFRYRVLCDGYAVDTPSGPQLWDQNNQTHLDAYYQGLVQPRAVKYRRVRQAFWCGPICLEDRWNPTPNNQIGWVPFTCFIEEKTGVPYGYVRDMIPIQDNLNTYLLRAMNAMDNAMLVGDHDRVKDWNAAREAVNRRNGVIQLDGSKPNGYFKIERHESLQASYLEMYRDQKGSMGYIHGLDTPSSITGQGAAGAQSGVQVRELRQNSAMAVGGPVANYRESRQKVLSLVLDRRIARLGDKPKEISYKAATGQAKKVAINVPVQLSDGSTAMMAPSQIRRHLVLDETPSTATYRALQLERLMDLARSLPEQMQLMLMPAIFESSEVKNRHLYAEQAMKMAGMSGPKDEAEAAELERKKDLQSRAEDAEVSGAEAKAAKDAAAAQKIAGEAATAAAVGALANDAATLSIQKTLAEIQQILVSIQGAKQDQRDQQQAIDSGKLTEVQGQLRW